MLNAPITDTYRKGGSNNSNRNTTSKHRQVEQCVALFESHKNFVYYYYYVI